MNFENSPSLPHAHQQIRLGDIQASAQKWTRAIECYLRAIEYFKTIQKSLYDTSLISNIQAQIIQCEKAIDFYHLKDRSEQAMKSERHSTITRAHSISNAKPSTTLNRKMPRYHTQQFDNTVLLGGRDEMDSFAALIFPNSNSERLTKTLSPLMAKNK